MKNLSLSLRLNLPSRPFSCSTSTSTNPPLLFIKPIKAVFNRKNSKLQTSAPPITQDAPPRRRIVAPSMILETEHSRRRIVVVGAVSVGFLLLLSGILDDQKALAFGPEGPLMEEEFWDNVRRYALYALSVSTGAIYAILVPIFELLKNPITAILIIAILGGSFFIVSQVLSAMFGVTDFSYDYNY